MAVAEHPDGLRASGDGRRDRNPFFLARQSILLLSQDPQRLWGGVENIYSRIYAPR